MLLNAMTIASMTSCVRQVDSTVIISEGIDDLATYLGVGNQVAALTASAMGGAVPFHEVFYTQGQWQ